jgi:prevent-host-death family protein
MNTPLRFGLEQARNQLPSIAAHAHAGQASILTKHGKPYAAVVSIEDMEKTRAQASQALGVLALRGSGRNLWGASPSKTVAALRDEWDEQ